MATRIARIALAGDAGGASAGNLLVGKAISAAFDRHVAGGGSIADTWFFYNGDTMYTLASSSTAGHPATSFWYSGSSIAKSRTVATPGNHDNGPGGSNPDVSYWISTFCGGKTATVQNGWIDQTNGIPNTDQHVDVGGIRFHFINSGAIEFLNATPGWPVPHTGGSVSGNARVTALRNAWLPGLNNVIVTHHGRYSVYGNHHDNPTMQNLVDEFLGVNDASGPHGQMWFSCHDHNMQLMKAQFASGSFPGIRFSVAGECGSGNYTGAPPASNTSQKSWLQFCNINAAEAFQQIDIFDDGSVVVSIIDASDTSGTLLANTSSVGTTGPATYTVTVGTSLSAPVAGTPALSDTTPTQGETLTCNDQAATWGGNPAPTFTHQWRRDTVNITGQTGSTYVVVSGDVVHTLDCVVVATNSQGSATATTSESSTVVASGSVPVNTTAPSITGGLPPTQGVQMTTDHGVWTNSPTSYHYAWYTRPTGGINAQGVGTDSPNYTPTAADIGLHIGCVVYGQNASGPGSEVSTGDTTQTVTASGGNYVTDTFERTVVNGIGTADSGHTYTIDTPDSSVFDVNGHELVLTGVAGNNTLAVVSAYTLADGIVASKYKADHAPVGGLSSWGPAVRFQDDLNYLRVIIEQLPAGTTTARLDKTIGGVLQTPVIAKTTISSQTPGSYYQIELDMTGPAYSLYIWPDGVAKPGSPTLTGTDPGEDTSSGSGYHGDFAADDGGGYCNCLAVDHQNPGAYMALGDTWGPRSCEDGGNNWHGNSQGMTGSFDTGRAGYVSQRVATSGLKFYGFGPMHGASDGAGYLAYSLLGDGKLVTLDGAHGFGQNGYGGTGAGSGPNGETHRPVGDMIVGDLQSGDKEYIYTITAVGMYRYANTGADASAIGGTTQIVPASQFPGTSYFAGMCLIDSNHIAVIQYDKDATGASVPSKVYMVTSSSGNLATASAGNISATDISGAAPNTVYEIHKGKDGHFYASCGTNGVYEVVLSGSSLTWTHIATLDQLVTSVDADTARNLWVGQAAPSTNMTAGHGVALIPRSGSSWGSIQYMVNKGFHTATYRQGDGVTPNGPAWWLGTKTDWNAGGFDVSQLRIDPFDDNKVIVVGRAGSWQTRDGGAHWYPASHGLNGGTCSNVRATGAHGVSADDADNGGKNSSDSMLSCLMGTYSATGNGKTISGQTTLVGLDGATYIYTPATSSAPAKLTKNNGDIADDAFRWAVIGAKSMAIDGTGNVYFAHTSGIFVQRVGGGSVHTPPLTSGGVGIYSNVAAGATTPVNWHLDNFQAGPSLAPPPTDTYEFSVDGGAYQPTGHTGADLSAALSGLSTGVVHTIKTRRVDSVTGNSDPATYAWFIPSGAPNPVVITGATDSAGNAVAQGGSTTSPDINIAFTTDAGTTVDAVIDGSSTIGNLTSPLQLTALSPGTHSVVFTATNVGGVHSTTATFGWTQNSISVRGPGSGSYQRSVILTGGIAGQDVPEKILVRASDTQSPPLTSVSSVSFILHLPTVGVQNPSVAIGSPSDGATVFAVDVPLAVSVLPDPADAIATVTATLDGATFVSLALVSTDPDGLQTWTGTITVPADSESFITVIATSIGGLTGSDTATIVESSNVVTQGNGTTVGQLAPTGKRVRYTVLHLDYAGNDVAEITPNDLHLEVPLNDIPSITYTLPLESKMARLSNTDPDAHDWLLLKDGKPLYGGQLLNADSDLTTRTLSVSGQGYLGYLATRKMPWNPFSVNVASQFRAYANTDQLEVVRRIMDYVIGTDNSIPLTYSHNMSGTLITQTFDPSSRDDMLSILKGQAEQHPGFDFDIDWSCQLNFYVPFKGSHTSLVLEKGANISAYSGSRAGKRGNRINATGTGFGNTQAVAVRQSIDAGARIVDEDIDFGVVKSVAMLDRLSIAELSQAKQPQRDFSVSIRRQDMWDYAREGDYILVDVEVDYDPIMGEFRCTNFQFDLTNQGDETYTYGFSAVSTVT